MSNKIKKTRVTVYVPEHLDKIADKSGAVKSHFYTEALEHIVNSAGGMKKMIREMKGTCVCLRSAK